MIKEKFGTLKNSLVKVDKKDNKKNIENLVVLAILLIVVIVAFNYIWKDDKKKNNLNNSNKVLADGNIIEEDTSLKTDDLERRLEEILSSINGVGEARVLITYSQTSTVNPIYNEDYDESVTEEEDTNGGKRTVSSSSNKKEVVSSSNNEIITQSVTSPQIQGAVVIAKGAGTPSVKTNIIQAVEAATGLATHKIQVFEMN